MNQNFRDNYQTLMMYLPCIVDCLLEKGIILDKVMIGYDFRCHSPVVFNHLVSLFPPNITICDIGLTTTPAIAHLAKRELLPAIMITASHNPILENGLKVFTNSGYPIFITDENDILNNLFVKASVCKTNNSVRIWSENDYYGLVWNERLFVNSKLSWIFTSGMESLIKKLKFQDTIHFDEEPDPEKRVIAPYLQDTNGYIISVDGDADKCIIYKDRLRINENKIITSLFLSYNTEVLVTNYEFNSCYYSFLRNIGKNVQQVSIGDQFILEKIVSTEYFGAEPNGHYIVPKTSSPDAILSALHYVKTCENIFLPEFSQSKIKVSYSTQESLEKDYQQLLDQKSMILDEVSFCVLEEFNRILIRKSKWEKSIVIVIDGTRAKERLNKLVSKLSGYKNRRVDYVGS